MLSGYLITWLLIGEYRTTGGLRLGAFYTRRALRLVPALVAASVVGVLAGLADGVGRPLDGVFAVTYLYDIYGAVSRTPAPWTTPGRWPSRSSSTSCGPRCC